MPRAKRATRFSAHSSIRKIDVSAYTIPTEQPESDGTLKWDKTTIIIVQARAGDCTGIGYTYADIAVATLIKNLLAPLVEGCDAMDIPGCWMAMVHCIRN